VGARFLVALVALALGAEAHAAPAAGVIVTGEPTLQGAIQAHAGKWLSEHGFGLVEAPLGDRARSLVDCLVIEDLGCAKKVFEYEAKSDVLFIRVDLVASSETRELALTGHWFTKGAMPTAEKRACKGCDDGALRVAVGRLLDALIKVERKRVPAARGGSRLAPALAIGAGAGLLAGGAAYLYYGRLSGPDDPYRYPDATKIGVALTATGAVALVGGALWWRRVRPVERGSRWAPIALVAGGVAALGGGAVALRYAAKRGVDEPFVYPSAVELGAPLAIAGGSALVAGTLLWLSRAPVHATVTPDGAIVGWAGRL
jgi:hypothetical protein